MDARPSGHKHVTGKALYVDDTRAGCWNVVCAVAARAREDQEPRRRRRRQMPGIHAVLFADDVPGMNDVGPVRHDEPLLATDEV